MNKKQLLSVMVANGDNQSTLADYLGIARATLSRKINEKGNAVFTQPEMAAIKKRYHLTDSVFASIFFA